MPKPKSPAAKELVVRQPPMLFDRTQELIQTLEGVLKGRLITYWNSSRGSVCHNDVLAFHELLQDIDEEEHIYLFLKSDGGSGQAALRIINLIRRHTRKLTALVPLNCASAATMIALGADEIQMGHMAYLTAVDTSLTHDLSPIDRDNDRVSVSLDELKRVVRLWREERDEKSTNPYHALFQYVHPLVIGAVDRADSLSIRLCKELLSFHIKDEKSANAIAQALNSWYPSHNYPILLNEAQRVGLKASNMDMRVSGLLLELNELYSEMGQRATTDIDEIRSHSNEIINIVERRNRLVFFQQDKDWFYRTDERRWITMNDHSSWRKVEAVRGKPHVSVLHIA